MALSLNINVPVAEPTAIGEKVIPTVQVFPARTLDPQVLLATAKGPLAVMPLMFNVVASLLVNVTVLAALVVPATVVLKLRLVTERVTGALPVPDKLTVWGVFVAVSLNANVPVAEPTAMGENVTPTVQVFAARTLVPQVLLATAKGPLAVIAVMVSVVA
jgi:hypothetical protein